MSEMIERVANAIMKVETDDKISDHYKFARAAIEAMREPSNDMIGNADLPYSPAEMKQYWQTMIDAALSEKP